MSNNKWIDSEDSDDKRPLIIAAVISIAAVIGLTVLALNHHSEGASKASANPGNTTTSAAGGVTTTAFPFVNTTTTAASGAAPAGDVHPETDILTASQLAYEYPKASSGLSSATYDGAVAYAASFSLADATGAGAANYSTYYNDQDNAPNKPWVAGYKFVFTSAHSVEDQPNLVKTVTYFSGTATSTKIVLCQVMSTVYLRGSGNSYQIVSPVDVENMGLEKPGFDRIIAS